MVQKISKAFVLKLGREWLHVAVGFTVTLMDSTVSAQILKQEFGDHCEKFDRRLKRADMDLTALKQVK